MKFKIFKLIKRLTQLSLLFLLGVIAFFIGESTYENIKKDEIINAFKSRADEVYTEEKYDTTYHYYPIKRIYDYELNDTRNVFYDDSKMYPGVKGDVLLTFKSPFPYIPILDPVISFWLGGHAALVSDNNQILQSTGMTSNGFLDISTMFNVIMHRGYDEENVYRVSVQQASNYWMIPHRTQSHGEYPYYGAYYRDEILATRVKFEDPNKIQEEIDIAVNFAKDKVNRGLYNYLFILDTQDKFYCSDLVTRSYLAVNDVNQTNYSLDDDGFIPSIQDMLISEDTYMTIYKETRADGIHIYYLEDIS